MGKAIDATGIQFKLLNRSRGPAVWSPRAQADKRRYGAWVAEALERESNITWIVGQAGRILVEQGRVAGLAMEDGESHSAGAVLVYDRDVSERSDPRRRRAAAGRSPRRAAIARAGGVDSVVRLRDGPAEDRDAAAAGTAAASTSPAASAAGVFAEEAATPTRCRSRFRRHAAAQPGAAAGCSTPTIASAISFARTSIAARCSTARSRGSARATVPRSKTRSCGFPIGSGTRSTSSRKDWTSTRST